MLMLACSGEPEVEPRAEHAVDGEHSHHAPDLRTRANRVFAPDGDTRWDRWLAGADTLTTAELGGVEAFLQDGCAHCHAGRQLDSEGAPPLRGTTAPIPHEHATEGHRAFLATLTTSPGP